MVIVYILSSVKCEFQSKENDMAKEPIESVIKRSSSEQLVDLKLRVNDAKKALINAELEKRALPPKPAGKK